MLIYNLLLLVPGRGTKPSLGAIRFSKACKLESKITPILPPARCALKGGFPVNASGVMKRAFRISPLAAALACGRYHRAIDSHGMGVL